MSGQSDDTIIKRALSTILDYLDTKEGASGANHDELQAIREIIARIDAPRGRPKNTEEGE